MLFVLKQNLLNLAGNPGEIWYGSWLGNSDCLRSSQRGHGSYLFLDDERGLQWAEELVTHILVLFKIVGRFASHISV